MVRYPKGGPLTVLTSRKFNNLAEFFDSLLFPNDHAFVHHFCNILDFFCRFGERIANQISLQVHVNGVCGWKLHIDPTALTWEALDFTSPEREKDRNKPCVIILGITPTT